MKKIEIDVNCTPKFLSTIVFKNMPEKNEMSCPGTECVMVLFHQAEQWVTFSG